MQVCRPEVHELLVKVLLPRQHGPRTHMLLQAATKAAFAVLPNPGAAVRPLLSHYSNSLHGASLALAGGAEAARESLSTMSMEPATPGRAEDQHSDQAGRSSASAQPSPSAADDNASGPSGPRYSDEDENHAAGAGQPSVRAVDEQAATLFTVVGMVASEQLRLTQQTVMLRRKQAAAAAPAKESAAQGELAAVASAGFDADALQV